MASVELVIEEQGLARALAAIDRLADLPTGDLLDVIGATVESQTRRRIEEEKTAPSGAAWKPNREGTPILLRTGRHLRDSIGYDVQGEAVAVGAAWEFAATHQFGAVIRPKRARILAFVSGGKTFFRPKVEIPARPFLGLSAENEEELVQVLEDFVGATLGERQ